MERFVENRLWSLVVLVLLLTSGLCEADTVTVPVPTLWSSEGWWVSTGLNLSQGDVLHVTATGQWNAWLGWDEWCGADGSSFKWNDQFLDPYGSGSNAEHFAALIGYVGVTPPPIGSYYWMTEPERLAEISRMVLLGSDVHVTAPASGLLWLGMNDDAYSGNVSDNAGQLDVTVALVPEPTGVVLLISGLMGSVLPLWRCKRL